MEFPQFPKEFSGPARAKVIAAEVRAGRAMNGPKAPQAALLGGAAAGRTGWVMQYIITVFASFAHEACELGRTQKWAVDVVDRESREFLRLTVSHARIKYSGPGSRLPEMLSNSNRSIAAEFWDLFERTDEWKWYQDELLKIAEIQAEPGSVAVTGAPVALPEPVLPPSKTRHFREPNYELLRNPEASLNRKNAAEALGITERTLDRWTEDRKLTPIGLGERKRYKVKDLLRLAGRKTPGQSRQE